MNKIFVFAFLAFSLSACSSTYENQRHIIRVENTETKIHDIKYDLQTIQLPKICNENFISYNFLKLAIDLKSIKVTDYVINVLNESENLLRKCIFDNTQNT